MSAADELPDSTVGERREPQLPTLHLVRHAKAGSRSRWTADDHERPLTGRGHRQSGLLTRYLLDDLGRRPSRIFSSPAVRCLETVAPLADECGLEIVETDWLDEGSDPDYTFAQLRTLTLDLDRDGSGGPVTAATHGDVVWGILELLVKAGVDLGDRPEAPKSGVWIIGFRSKSPPSASFFLPDAS